MNSILNGEISMKYFLGIDFGGGSSKATLVDEKGNLVHTANSEYPTTYDENGLATQRPDDWLEAALSNIKAILSQGIDPEQIEAVCFSAATHTAVLLGEKEEVLCDSIYWTDTRSRKEKEELLSHHKDEIFAKCKHLPDTIWTLPELMFLRKESSEIYARIRHILFAKDYIRHRFCPGLVTDYIEAEGSMLFDFDKKEWDDGLLALAGLNKGLMPSITHPLSIVGTISPEASRLSGLSTKTKVLCGSTDTAMEVLASGGVKEGDMTVKLATAGRICLITSRPYPDKNIINYSHLDERYFYPGSGTKSCAASLRWFRDAFGGDFASLSDSASSIPLGADGLLFVPYLMGELTPHANPAIRGAFFGISSLHGKPHFVRALLEGVALSLLDCYRYLESRGLPLAKEAYVLGGGAKSPLWRQIVADVLGIKLRLGAVNDSSFGDCLCAMVACGRFPSLREAVEKTQKIVEIIEPNEKNHREYEKIFARYKRLTEFIVGYYGDE